MVLIISDSQIIISEENGVTESNVDTIRTVIQSDAGASKWAVYREIAKGGRYNYVWIATVDNKLWTVRGRLDSNTGAVSVQSADRRSGITVQAYKTILEDLGYSQISN